MALKGKCVSKGLKEIFCMKIFAEIMIDWRELSFLRAFSGVFLRGNFFLFLSIVLSNHDHYSFINFFFFYKGIQLQHHNLARQETLDQFVA